MARRRGQRTAGAITLSLLAHGLVLTALVLGIRIYRSPGPDPAIQVALVPPWPMATPQMSDNRPPVAPRAAAPKPPDAPAPPPAVPFPPALGPSGDAPKEGGQQAEHLRDALKGMIGCGSPVAYKLTEEQRKACDQRARQSGLAHFQLDPAKQAAFDADSSREPVLARDPKNGCAPRVGRQEPENAYATAASTSGGVKCAWQF